jgi:energy-coupling factor transport system substrate-specific component
MSKLKLNFSIRDITIIAALSALGGLAVVPMANLWYIATLSIGSMADAIFGGINFWNYMLAAALVRKPGTALSVGLLTGAVELVMGNQAGVAVLGWTILNGIAIEIIFAMVNYKDYSYVTMLMGGAVGGEIGRVWSAILYGWDVMDPENWTPLPLSMLTGAIISGTIAYLLLLFLRRSGLVRQSSGDTGEAGFANPT